MKYAEEIRSRLIRKTDLAEIRSPCGMVFTEPIEPWLFKGLWVDTSGKSKPAFYAYATVARTNYGFFYQELSRIQLITSVAKVKERGWTEIASKEEARHWADSLAEVYQAEVALLIRSELDDLRLNTDDRCRLAEQYANRFAEDVAHTEAIEKCLNKPGVRQVVGHDETYRNAIGLVFNNSEQLEGRDYSNDEPLESVHFMCLIQLTFDELRRRKSIGAANESQIWY